MTTSVKEHWNKIYSSKATTELSWYEEKPSPSIDLIEKCAIPRQSPVIDIGSGASTLIPHLVDLGYQKLYALDISEVALDKAKGLLSEERAAKVHWIIDDIVNPDTVLQLPKAAIWHDRAVFHFLTEESHRHTYRSVMQKVIMPGGFAILATFALDGASRCSGLPVQRYNAESLSEFLGEGFRLIESLDYTYRMPSGDLRPYVYGRFQKI